MRSGPVTFYQRDQRNCRRERPGRESSRLRRYQGSARNCGLISGTPRIVTELERLQGILMAAIKRIEALEATRSGGSALDADEASAQRLAEQIGFSPSILLLPASRSQRVALALELRRKQWSVARIARVLRTGERNVERWIAGGKEL